MRDRVGKMRVSVPASALPGLAGRNNQNDGCCMYGAVSRISHRMPAESVIRGPRWNGSIYISPPG